MLLVHAESSAIRPEEMGCVAVKKLLRIWHLPSELAGSIETGGFSDNCPCSTQIIFTCSNFRPIFDYFLVFPLLAQDQLDLGGAYISQSYRVIWIGRDIKIT